MASILKVDTIQDQAGNNIISEAANVITIGASGDTITVPAGATVSGFTSAGIDDNATSTAITINSSEQVAFTDGTASLPSITNLGDENTGMFFPAANQIGFATNGAETVRINANGAMALGTTTINDKLHVFNGSTGSNTGTAIRLGQGYNSAHTRITSNFGGSVSLDAGIGASQPEIRFKTNNITRQKLASNGDISFYEDTGTTPKFFWDASAERLGIGTSSPSQKLDVNGTVKATSFDGAGRVLQVIQTTKTDTATYSVGGNGGESSNVMPTNITPSSASNKVLIQGQFVLAVPTTNVGVILFRGSTEIFSSDSAGSRNRATAMSYQDTGSTGTVQTIPFTFLDSPSSTSALTYQVKFTHASSATQTIYQNRIEGDGDTSKIFRGTSSLTVMEIQA
jgi:ribosomal protein S4E